MFFELIVLFAKAVFRIDSLFTTFEIDVSLKLNRYCYWDWLNGTDYYYDWY